MKRVIIVVEGQTEQEFVEQCLRPFLYDKYGLSSVSARLIGKPGHKGGDVRYSRLKRDLNILLRESNADICRQYSRSEDRIACLEEGLSQIINAPTFIPYIQRHEFEALLFASDGGFVKYFNSTTRAKLAEINQRYPNPEDINDTEPPSYRLLQIVLKYEGFKYDKVTFGNILALEVGIETMLIACPRFAQWVARLGQAATT